MRPFDRYISKIIDVLSSKGWDWVPEDETRQTMEKIAYGKITVVNVVTFGQKCHLAGVKYHELTAANLIAFIKYKQKEKKKK